MVFIQIGTNVLGRHPTILNFFGVACRPKESCAEPLEVPMTFIAANKSNNTKLYFIRTFNEHS